MRLGRLFVFILTICFGSIFSQRFDPCRMRRPVCGSNDRTYRNPCLARRAGVKIECLKRCPCSDSCFCPPVDRPVCGTDGNTYKNECAATICNNVKVECRGRCPCSSMTDTCQSCPKFNLFPVCGQNDRTYDNFCKAECARTEVQCVGRCPCRIRRDW